MDHEGFDSGAKRVFMGFGDLVNGINVWPISEGMARAAGGNVLF